MPEILPEICTKTRITDHILDMEFPVDFIYFRENKIYKAFKGFGIM